MAAEFGSVYPLF